MVTCKLIRPVDLEQRDREAWAAMTAAEPRFANPLLSFDFTLAVAAVRPDVFVAVYSRDGETIAFLPHHRTHGGTARPVGAPFSDYHALISGPDPRLTGEEALSLAGLRRFGYAGLVDPWRVFGETVEAKPAYAYIAPDGEAATQSKHRTWAKQRRKLEREHGSVRFIGPNRDPDALRTVLGWKSAQLRASGLHDVLAPTWVRTLMADLHGRQGEAFGGVLTTLETDGGPVAGSFGVRAGEHYHAWIISHDPAFAAYSPGSLLQIDNFAAMPGMHLRSWDLGWSTEGFKARMANRTEMVTSGVAIVDGRAPWWERSPTTQPGRSLRRLARRLDQIAAVEPTLGGRLHGIAAMVAGAGQRLAVKD